MSEQQGYWWCPECKDKIAPEHVTFQECHTSCGHETVWIKAQPTWRGHTCGECGWAVAQGYHKYLKCRRTAWGVHQVEGSVWCENIGHILAADPSCPAFVQRDEPSE